MFQSQWNLGKKIDAKRAAIAGCRKNQESNEVINLKRFLPVSCMYCVSFACHCGIEYRGILCMGGFSSAGDIFIALLLWFRIWILAIERSSAVLFFPNSIAILSILYLLVEIPQLSGWVFCGHYQPQLSRNKSLLGALANISLHPGKTFVFRIFSKQTGLAVAFWGGCVVGRVELFLGH